MRGRREREQDPAGALPQPLSPPPEPCRAGRFEPRPGAGPKMISRGSWRLSRKCANGKRRRRLVRSPARRRGRPEPRNQIQKAGGAQRPAARGPGVGEGGRRASGSPARGGAAAAAQVRSRLSPTWRGRRQPGGDRRPGPGGGAAAVPGAALAPGRGGSGPAPRSHFVLCKSA